MENESKSGAVERGFYAFLGAIALAFASLPYVLAWRQTPPGHVFTGLIPNIDDSCTYLSWISYAADGHFFQRNRFATETQGGILFNLYFVALGQFARVLPAIAVFHAARILGGAAMLWASTKFLGAALSSARARKIAFSLICFGSGIGWVFGGFDPARAFDQSVDTFQHEAFPFLCLYYSPLFAPACALALVFLTAVLRAESSGKWRDLIPATISGGLLGNAHTYDIVPLLLTALAFRVVTDRVSKSVSPGGWARLLVASAPALLAAGFVFYALKTDPIFAARAAVETKTAAPWWILTGFGLPIGFALALLAPQIRARSAFVSPLALRFCLVAVASWLICAYLPVAFQRKMLMGIAFPLFALAGAGLDALLTRFPGSSPGVAKLVATVAVAATFPSGALLLSTDVSRLSRNAAATALRPYLTDSEKETFAWLSQHAVADDFVLVGPDTTAHLRYPNVPLMPALAGYVPALTPATVFNGHWGETPNYGRKLAESLKFFTESTTDDERRALVSENKIRYVLYPKAIGDGPLRNGLGETILDASGNPAFVGVDWRTAAPPWLKLTHESADMIVYESIHDENRMN